MFFQWRMFPIVWQYYYPHVLTQCGPLKGNVLLLLEYVVPKTVERDGVPSAPAGSHFCLADQRAAPASLTPSSLFYPASDYEANSRSPLCSLESSLLLALAVLFLISALLKLLLLPSWRTLSCHLVPCLSHLMVGLWGCEIFGRILVYFLCPAETQQFEHLVLVHPPNESRYIGPCSVLLLCSFLKPHWKVGISPKLIDLDSPILCDVEKVPCYRLPGRLVPLYL